MLVKLPAVVEKMPERDILNLIIFFQGIDFFLTLFCLFRAPFCIFVASVYKAQLCLSV